MQSVMEAFVHVQGAICAWVHAFLWQCFGSPGLSFGFSFETVDRYGAKGMAAVGTFGWGGAYGSTYEVDPADHLVLVFIMQLMPGGTDIQQRFSNAVYQALLN